MQKYSPLFKLTHVMAVLVLALGSLAVSIALKSRQLDLFAPVLVRLYPLTYWLHSWLVTFLLFLTTWLATSALLAQFHKHHPRPQSLEKLMLLDACTYLCLALVWALTIHGTLTLFLIFKVSLVAYYWLRARQTLWTAHKPHWVALAGITFVQVFFNGFLSPFAWGNPLAAVNQQESALLAMYSGMHQTPFTLAKFLDFSGFDHTAWGSFPIWLSGAGYVIPFLTLMFDLPLIDVETYFRLLLQLFFVLTIMSSFGFYLFILKGLQLSHFVSVMGGMLYIVSNRFLGQIFTNHFPTFVSVFLALPWALLLSTIAVRNRSLGWAWASGAVFALNFIILQPHPDPVIHGTLFWLGFNLFITHPVEVGARFRILIVSLLGFGLASFLIYGPLVESLLAKQASVFGHQKFVIQGDLNYGLKTLFIPVLKTFGIFLVMLALWFRKPLTEYQTKPHLLFFLAVAIVLMGIFIPRSSLPLEWIFEHLGITFIRLANSARIEMYLYLCCLVLSLYGMEFFLGKQTILSKPVAAIAWLSLGLVIFTKWALVPNLVLVVMALGAVTFWVFQRHLVTSLSSPPGFAAGFAHGLVPGCAVIAAVCALILQESPYAWTSPRRIDNPSDCRPYITLQSLSQKHGLFPEDSAAGQRVLRSRLLAFERDILKSKTSGRAAASYLGVLAEFHATSASQINADAVESVTEQSQGAIDGFYVNDFDCQYPPHSKRTFVKLWEGVYYNNISLYENIGSRFQRMLTAIGPTDHPVFAPAGIGQGYFMNDATQLLDPNFMSGYRPIYSLYLVPGEDWTDVGHYLGPSLWQQGTELVSEPLKRHIMNIGGVDIFTFLKARFDQVKDKADLEVIPFSIPEAIRPPFTVVRDRRSYGIAYLAKSINYTKPIDNLLTFPTPPLSKNDEKTIGEYRGQVFSYLQRLNALGSMHSIILEDDRFPEGREERMPIGNWLSIVNIAGNKAAFQVHCFAEPCILVFNSAAGLGWRAFIDKVATPIQRANFAFLSVSVPVGDHFVWLENRRWGMALGAYATAIAYLITAFVMLRNARSHAVA